MALFHALIDLNVACLPSEMAIEDAIDRVKVALESLAGVGSVSVNWYSSSRAKRSDICILDGSEMPLDCGARERLAKLVDAEINNALFPPPTLVL